MACKSCGLKQQNRTYLNQTKTVIEIPVECVYTKEQIQTKLDELRILYKSASGYEKTLLSISILRLERAVEDYDNDCNKYLITLYELLGT